jgi:transcriptional regulator of heat shock response
MEERQLGVMEEVKAKEEVWDARSDFDKFMNEATQTLANKTNSLALAATDDGEIYKAGMKNIFDNPEFDNLAVCHDIFSIIEEVNKMHELFFEKLTGMHPVEVLFGPELAWPSFENVGIIAKRFNIKNKKGAIGVMTAYRKAPQVIPVVRYIGSLIEELTL